MKKREMAEMVSKVGGLLGHGFTGYAVGMRRLGVLERQNRIVPLDLLRGAKGDHLLGCILFGRGGCQPSPTPLLHLLSLYFLAHLQPLKSSFHFPLPSRTPLPSSKT